MAQSQSKKEIIEAIIDMQSEMYVENMKLIIEHHIVDEVAKSEINRLIERMDHFSDENYFAEKEKQDKTEIKVSSYPANECVQSFIRRLYERRRTSHRQRRKTIGKRKKASHRTGKQNAHPGGWKNP